MYKLILVQHRMPIIMNVCMMNCTVVDDIVCWVRYNK